METKNKRSQIPESTRETRNTWSIKRENALQGMGWDKTRIRIRMARIRIRMGDKTRMRG